jgi:hypothetical protein
MVAETVVFQKQTGRLHLSLLRGLALADRDAPAEYAGGPIPYRDAYPSLDLAGRFKEVNLYVPRQTSQEGRRTQARLSLLICKAGPLDARSGFGATRPK